ncbi:30S ribosomal protein S27ae [Candidatus Micrarchaeota archaeon]|nr:30S ribosomal protein S27ae [Candidatus Micrarchaeota archaeon]
MAEKEKGGRPVVWFDVKGAKLERKKQTCPKCGDGYWMAEHKDRVHCGHCGYTRWKSKEQPALDKKS